MNRLLVNSRGAAQSAKMGFRKVTHVIFDMDGLLLDTETLYTKVTQAILDKYGDGQTYTWEMKTSLMGLQREEVAQRLVEHYNLPLTPEEYVELTMDHIKLLMSDCNQMPDTEGIYERIVGDIAKSFQKTYDRETRLKVLGTTELKTAEIVVNDLKLPISVPEFRRIFTDLGNQRLGTAPLLRGASKLVNHLHANSIPIALATSSSVESLEVKTAKHQELFKLFHHKVMGSSDSEVKSGKPAPDIFLVAARRFPDNPNPEDCLVFEDAPNGVKAARAAGMQVVMVPDEHITEEQKQGATVVLKSLEDVKLEDFGLPPLPA
ncbi:pseudouridine-5'-phosphatase [Sergentomyia squamirostris]